MTALETDLATHLRYHVWATRRTLQAVAELSPEEYLRDLQTSHRSVQGTLEHMLGADWGWYERLAGEPPGIAEPLEDGYSIFANLETDYRVLLRKYDLLASFLDDLELALHFAHSEIYVPWLQASIPKWQGVMNIVSHGTYHRGQIASMVRQLGYEPIETDMMDYFLELAGKLPQTGTPP